MSEAGTLAFIYAETPLHPGTGSSLGVVDLPVQRERTTNFPTIQGSSLKGVLRAQTEDETAKSLFGQQEQAGLLSFSDAKLLLFPVRSLKGVFTWITCSAVLARLVRDLSALQVAVDWKDIPDVVQGKTLVTNTSDLVIQGNSQQVALEEYLFTPETSEWASKVAAWLAKNALPATDDFVWWRSKLQKSLIVLHDDDFRDFVTTATEVVARTALDAKTKTVKNGALWYQEFLPAETLFYSVAFAQSRNQGAKGSEVLQQFKDLKIERIQIGGDETTGKGFCKVRYL
ncbi:type III-B CRISPR module RAMP protein Cmr4 [Candidatus Chlorohelix sp.]|uniref:type III-B CRISPR module RAMP protein Cmr4 n=1 Tax=Candidatus Chlorohelix sp. TaxID=3139201 RepID=UPI003046D88B